ncbi:Lactonase, 7-bladed beta-propeller-domain-containing protein [Diplogelasinospora grovesii]|uniref:Lactonase, 7-bladed beta-propeller-domain-containing protein n=1 Tax=Diplogelasinospora grovesii TaxID=303347 RepID=A0AAN6NG77_9PEZI|nr:Lactonase, 7-bladed beta-propeller-domain-containing protein [Diplogelasinospora grovesii]
MLSQALLLAGYAGTSALALALPSNLNANQGQALTNGLIYVTSYAGTVTTLNLTIVGTGLQTVASTTDCGVQPSWLTLDKTDPSIVYCVDESWGKTNGTLASFRKAKNGSLSLLSKVGTIGGPVNAVVYGEGNRGLAVADYAGGGFSTFDIAHPSTLAPLQSQVFTLPHPGVVPDRQEAPHPHEAILDPTGDYLLVPDLGSDLVRIFAINRTSLAYTPVTPLVAAPGSGPRHGVFLTTEAGKTFFYLIAELANTITGYEVTYNKKNSTLSFTQFYLSGSHGLGNAVPAGAAAAEIALSPDKRFLIASSRNEASFTIPNFDPKNATTIPSDALINFSVDADNGNLTAIQTVPAGGMVPRHFSINKAGTLLGVGLQGDGRVVIVARDPRTGLLESDGHYVANASVAGGVNCVIFDEYY